MVQCLSRHVFLCDISSSHFSLISLPGYDRERDARLPLQGIRFPVIVVMRILVLTATLSLDDARLAAVSVAVVVFVDFLSFVVFFDDFGCDGCIQLLCGRSSGNSSNSCGVVQGTAMILRSPLSAVVTGASTLPLTFPEESSRWGLRRLPRSRLLPRLLLRCGVPLRPARLRRICSAIDRFEASPPSDASAPEADGRDETLPWSAVLAGIARLEGIGLSISASSPLSPPRGLKLPTELSLPRSPLCDLRSSCIGSHALVSFSMCKRIS